MLLNCLSAIRKLNPHQNLSTGRRSKRRPGKALNIFCRRRAALEELGNSCSRKRQRVLDCNREVSKANKTSENRSVRTGQVKLANGRPSVSRRPNIFIPTYPDKLPSVGKPPRASRTWSKRIAVAVRRMMKLRVVKSFIPIYPNNLPNVPKPPRASQAAPLIFSNLPASQSAITRLENRSLCRDSAA